MRHSVILANNNRSKKLNLFDFYPRFCKDFVVNKTKQVADGYNLLHCFFVMLLKSNDNPVCKLQTDSHLL
jgi:hypothetical protein